MKGQKEQALSPEFYSHMIINKKHFSRFLYNLRTTYEYKYIKKAYLGALFTRQ